MRPGRPLVPWAWGALLAIRLALPMFLLRDGQMWVNHEGYTYVYRVIEFMDCLRAGYALPQWAPHFRQGLGSPYFGYYQPGLFYVASLFGVVMPPLQALAATIAAFAMLGYASMFTLVRRRFGTASGMVAGTTLLEAPYALDEIYNRGDLSEYAGMLVFAALLGVVVRWLDEGRPTTWLVLALGGCALVLLHPVAGLLGYGALGLVIVCDLVARRRLGRALGAAGALASGMALSAFYWLPLRLEWDFVSNEQATRGFYSYVLHFVPIGVLLGTERSANLSLPCIGWVLSAGIVVTTAMLAWRWRATSPAQRRLVATAWLVAIVAAGLMTPTSRPLWDHVSVLQLAQFPWRLFIVLTPALALVVGCNPMRARFLQVAFVVALLLGALTMDLFIVGRFRGRDTLWHFPHPQAAADMTAFFVAPDGRDEWLPRTAHRLVDAEVPREPECTGCRVESLERGTSWLRARVRGMQLGVLVLPQYFFPVGWRVTIDGAPAAAGPDERGLMEIILPHDGLVEATFVTTPAKRLGAAVSGVSLALVILGVAVAQRRRRAAGTAVADDAVGTGERKSAHCA